SPAGAKSSQGDAGASHGGCAMGGGTADVSSSPDACRSASCGGRPPLRGGDWRLTVNDPFIAAEHIPQGAYFNLEGVNTCFELAHAAVRSRRFGPKPDKQCDG